MRSSLRTDLAVSALALLLPRPLVEEFLIRSQVDDDVYGLAGSVRCFPFLPRDSSYTGSPLPTITKRHTHTHTGYPLPRHTKR